jgi:hypothetical protein
MACLGLVILISSSAQLVAGTTQLTTAAPDWDKYGKAVDASIDGFFVFVDFASDPNLKSSAKLLTSVKSLSSLLLPQPASVIVGGTLGFFSGLFDAIAGVPSAPAPPTTADIMRKLKHGFDRIGSKVDGIDKKLTDMRTAVLKLDRQSIQIRATVRSIRDYAFYQEDLYTIDSVYDEAMKRMEVALGDNGTTWLDFTEYVKAKRTSLSAFAQNKGVLSPIIVEGVLQRSISDQGYCKAAEVYHSIVASLFKLNQILFFGAAYRSATLAPLNGQASRHLQDLVDTLREYEHVLRRLKLDVLAQLAPHEMVACSDPPKFSRIGVGLCDANSAKWTPAGNLDAAACATACEQKVDCWLIAVKPGPTCLHFLSRQPIGHTESSYSLCSSTSLSLEAGNYTTFKRQGPLNYQDLGHGVCKEFVSAGYADPAETLKAFDFKQDGQSRSVLDQCAARCLRDGSKCKAFSIWASLECRFYFQDCTAAQIVSSSDVRTFAKLEQMDDETLRQGKYTLRHAVDNGKYLNMDSHSWSNNVHVWNAISSSRSHWLLESVASGAFILQNDYTKLKVGVKAGSIDNGANVQAHACHGYQSNTACHWRLSKVSHSSTTYLLQNVNSGRYLNVAGGSTSNGANAQQWGTASSDSQWQLHKVTENKWVCHHPQNIEWCRTAVPDGNFEYSYFGAGGACGCACCKRKLSCSAVPGAVVRERASSFLPWPASETCKCRKQVVDGVERESYLAGTGYFLSDKDPCPHGADGTQRYFNIEDLIGKGCSCELK